MAYLNAKDKYLRQVTIGKTISDLKQKGDSVVIQFNDGTSLRLLPYLETRRKVCGCRQDTTVIIASAYHADGSCIQTTEVLKTKRSK